MYFVFNVNFEHDFAYCHCTKNKLSIKYFFSKETADLFTFTKEILNGKRMCQMSSNDPVLLKILGNISPKPLSPVNLLGIQNFHLAAEKAIK